MLKDNGPFKIQNSDNMTVKGQFSTGKQQNVTTPSKGEKNEKKRLFTAHLVPVQE